eukprot:Sspe_Gene.91835::Locus_63470_Transcript_1_1_Confidence_1.000_Length_1426::g.91835::m.91835
MQAPQWPRVRWVVAVGCAGVMLCNHWARDVPGALERQLEDGVGLSVMQYDWLNTAYFAMSVVMPLVAGWGAMRWGATACWLSLLTVGGFGHGVFWWGCASSRYPLLLCGRILQGAAYEAVDMLSLPILGHLFDDSWGFVVGLSMAGLRLGSVASFLVSPWVYKGWGLCHAVWVGSMAGLTALPLGMAVGWARREVVHSLDIEDGDFSEPVTPRAPLRSYPTAFWFFVAAGCAVHGVLLPWLTVGGKYLQHQHHLSVSRADLYMLFPEAGVVLLGPLLGYSVDSFLPRPSSQLLVASLSALLFPAAFLLFHWSVTPLVPATLLALGWVLFSALYWGAVKGVTPAARLSEASGLIGAALNCGAAGVPQVLTYVSYPSVILILGSLGVAGCLCLLLAACTVVDPLPLYCEIPQTDHIADGDHGCADSESSEGTASSTANGTPLS